MFRRGSSTQLQPDPSIARSLPARREYYDQNGNLQYVKPAARYQQGSPYYAYRDYGEKFPHRGDCFGAETTVTTFKKEYERHYPDNTFEALWDCKGCGTKKLLGKTHRCCPVSVDHVSGHVSSS